MKDRKYKYVDDLIEDYLELLDEQIEIPLLIAKAEEKREAGKPEQPGLVLKHGDAADQFKLFQQIKKYEERKKELSEELDEVESLFKAFLEFVDGSKISYEKKDDSKTKITYLFWLEDGQIKSNR